MEDEIKFTVVQFIEGDKWKHLIQDKQLHISKGDKVIITLNDNEIMRMLKSLGIATADFEHGFDFENKE